MPLGLVGRVGAQQVVEREPAGQVLGGHVRPGQLAQRGARLGPGDPGQAGRRGQRDVRARVQAEQPEHPRRGRAELVIGPGQHGPHVGGRVAFLQRVQPAPGVAQFGRQLGQRAPGPAGGGPADRDGQRQREAGARRDDLVRRLRLGRDAVPAEPAGQHLVGLVVAEHVQREQRGPLRGDQPGHLVAAGHHDQAARRAGQQRAHLGGVARVVEHDQHPLAVEQAAVQGRPVLGPTAIRCGGTPKLVEEEPQRLARLHRRRARIQAAQVDVQLAVREALGHLAPEADGQRGLAHPGRAGDDDDRHRLVGRRPGRRQQRVQHAEFFVAAGEALGVQRQLRRDGTPGPARRPGRVTVRAGRVRGVGRAGARGPRPVLLVRLRLPALAGRSRSAARFSAGSQVSTCW